MLTTEAQDTLDYSQLRHIVAEQKLPAVQLLLEGYRLRSGTEPSNERPVVREYIPSALTPGEYLHILAHGSDALPIFDVSGYPELRFSASSLLRLCGPDGSILLSWNGKYNQFSPIGGGLEITDALLRDTLLSRGARWEIGNELRCAALKPCDAAQLVEWFSTGEGRESGAAGAAREMREELVDELALMSTEECARLSVPKPMGHGFKFAPDRKGVQTIYVVDICEASLPPDVAMALQSRITQRTDVAFVSQREILTGQTNDGRSIESLSRYLVHPLSELPMIRS